MHPQRSVQLLLMLYIYDPVADTFVPLPDMPAELPLQIHNAVHALQTIDAGKPDLSQLLPSST